MLTKQKFGFIMNISLPAKAVCHTCKIRNVITVLLTDVKNPLNIDFIM